MAQTMTYRANTQSTQRYGGRNQSVRASRTFAQDAPRTARATSSFDRFATPTPTYVGGSAAPAYDYDYRFDYGYDYGYDARNDYAYDYRNDYNDNRGYGYGYGSNYSYDFAPAYDYAPAYDDRYGSAAPAYAPEPEPEPQPVRPSRTLRPERTQRTQRTKASAVATANEFLDNAYSTIASGANEAVKQARTLPAPVMVALAAAIVIVALVIICFVRIGLSSDTVLVQMRSQEITDTITSTRSAGRVLEVQKGALSNASRIRSEAIFLGMMDPEATESLVLRPDTVTTDDAGNLSLAGSVARVAQAA